MHSIRTKKRKVGILIVLNIAFLPVLVFAMNSQNFKIDADTVNSGGNLSGSGNFRLGDSAGEAATGEERSANFKSKTAFWYMIPDGSQLGLDCQSSDVYMMDYTLGTANDYSLYTFSSSEHCTITDNSSASWSLTMQSTNMTGTKNNLSNANIDLSTNGDVATGNTITTPTTGLTESTGDNPLDSPKTILTGDVTASGVYENQPTMKLTNLNSLFNETISGSVTITLQ